MKNQRIVVIYQRHTKINQIHDIPKSQYTNKCQEMIYQSCNVHKLNTFEWKFWYTKVIKYQSDNIPNWNKMKVTYTKFTIHESHVLPKSRVTIVATYRISQSNKVKAIYASHYTPKSTYTRVNIWHNQHICQNQHIYARINIYQSQNLPK